MIYSKFVRDLGDKTKIPLRTIEAEWKICERELNNDVMMEPSKYQNLKKLTGSFYEEVARRVEKNLIKPDAESNEVLPELPTEAEKEALGVE